MADEQFNLNDIPSTYRDINEGIGDALGFFLQTEVLAMIYFLGLFAILFTIFKSVIQVSLEKNTLMTERGSKVIAFFLAIFGSTGFFYYFDLATAEKTVDFIGGYGLLLAFAVLMILVWRTVYDLVKETDPEKRDFVFWFGVITSVLIVTYLFVHFVIIIAKRIDSTVLYEFGISLLHILPLLLIPAAFVWMLMFVTRSGKDGGEGSGIVDRLLGGGKGDKKGSSKKGTGKDGEDRDADIDEIKNSLKRIDQNVDEIKKGFQALVGGVDTNNEKVPGVLGDIRKVHNIESTVIYPSAGYIATDIGKIIHELSKIEDLGKAKKNFGKRQEQDKIMKNLERYVQFEQQISTEIANFIGSTEAVIDLLQNIAGEKGGVKGSEAASQLRVLIDDQLKKWAKFMHSYSGKQPDFELAVEKGELDAADTIFHEVDRLNEEIGKIAAIDDSAKTVATDFHSFANSMTNKLQNNQTALALAIVNLTHYAVVMKEFFENAADDLNPEVKGFIVNAIKEGTYRLFEGYHEENSLEVVRSHFKQRLKEGLHLPEDTDDVNNYIQNTFLRIRNAQANAEQLENSVVGNAASAQISTIVDQLRRNKQLEVLSVFSINLESFMEFLTNFFTGFPANIVNDQDNNKLAGAAKAIINAKLVPEGGGKVDSDTWLVELITLTAAQGRSDVHPEMSEDQFKWALRKSEKLIPVGFTFGKKWFSNPIDDPGQASRSRWKNPIYGRIGNFGENAYVEIDTGKRHGYQESLAGKGHIELDIGKFGSVGQKEVHLTLHIQQGDFEGTVNLEAAASANGAAMMILNTSEKSMVAEYDKVDGLLVNRQVTPERIRKTRTS